MTGLNPSITSDTIVHFNGYLSNVSTGDQVIVPLDIELDGLKAIPANNGNGFKVVRESDDSKISIEKIADNG
jgi:hypothetical protein